MNRKDKSPGVFLGLCPFCGKENGEIVLDGVLKIRDNDPRHVMTMDACDECKDKMQNGNVGIILIDPSYIRVAADGRLNPKDVKRIEGGAMVRRDVLEALVGNEIQGSIIFMDIEMFNHLFKKDDNGNIGINQDRIEPINNN